MAGEAELKIGSESVEKTTAALDSLITVLEKLLTAQTRQEKSNNDTTKSVDAATAAVKQSEIARNKAISLLDLESKGLDKTGDAYNRLKGEILAQEVAAKKNINTAEADYQQILENIAAKEQAVIANKKLIESTTGTTNAMKASEAAAIKATSLYELEQKKLNSLSDEYAHAKAEILAKDIAARKGIDTNSKEYRQILDATKAQEEAIVRTKELTAQKKKLGNQAGSTGTIINGLTESLDDAGKQMQLLDGPLGGIASRMTALSSILKSGAIVFAAVGISLAALTAGMAYGASVASDQEVRMSTLEAQIRVTGGAAGYTAEQLDILSRSLAGSTLNSSQGFKEIITQLQVFDKVADQAFGRAVSLTSDLAIAMQGSASESAKKLGKVLQDPLKYYTELAEVGVTFNETQLDTIKSAQLAGDLYKAQSVILDALEGKIKGIASAQANGLAGDLDTFGQKWEEFWETSGKKALPILREIVQTGSLALDYAQQGIETESETKLRQFKQSTLEQTQTLEGTRELIKSVSKEYDTKLATAGKTMTAEQKFWFDYEVGINEATNALRDLVGIEQKVALVNPDKVDAYKTETAIIKEERDAQLKYLKEIEDLKSGRKPPSESLTLEQTAYIKSLKDTAAQEAVLAKVFLETGDTRSESYRSQKAAFDAYNEAVKNGLNLSPKELANLNAIFQARQQVTESIVAGNIAIQKEKAVRSQQGDLQKEIELNKLVANGLQLNSAEYLKTAALIDLRNKALLAGEPVSGAAYENLQKETIALTELQSEMKQIAALRQYDSESSTTKALEKSLELYELTKKGLSETSDEYIRASMAINARNTALQAGKAVGSDEYNQILAQADAVATLQIKLQSIKDIESLGLKFNMDKELISEDSLEGLQDTANRSIKTIMDVALKQGISVDSELIKSVLADVNTKFQEGKDQLVLPLGLAFDKEGALYELESAYAVRVEMNEKLNEMDLAAKELGIENETAYRERRYAVIKEYSDKEFEVTKKEKEKSAEDEKRRNAGGLVDVVDTIGKTIEATKSGNKTMARVAKAAAIFKASAGLVDQLTAAAGVTPYWAKFAAYAEAAATGGNIIAMASGLKEPSFAFGGVDIQGAGTGRSDSIKANIARGESVVTAPATAQYKETLKRMNAGLPINGGSSQSVTVPLSINIQGDASENTVRLIDESLRNFEERVQQISQGVSMQTIQSEQNYGGLLNQF